MRFNPNDYGDPYTKRTCLWGRFTPPVPDSMLVTTKSVPATEGSKMHLLAPSPDRQRLRSETPMGFAQAFYEANP